MALEGKVRGDVMGTVEGDESFKVKMALQGVDR